MKLKKKKSRPKINNLLSNINKEINTFIKYNRTNQELQQKINEIIKEFNIKINVLPEQKIESYTDIVNEFNEQLVNLTKTLKPNNNVYDKEINKLIIRTKKKI